MGTLVDHPPLGVAGALNRLGMTVLSTEVRTLLGAEVDVETEAGTLHGTLLSCTRRSLWLVDGEDDLMVQLDRVNAVHLP